MEMMKWSWISYEPLKFKNLELSYTSRRCYQSSTSASLTSKAAWRSGPTCHWLASVLRWDSPPNAEIRGTSLWVVKGRHFGGGGRTDHHFRVNMPMYTQFWLIIVSQNYETPWVASISQNKKTSEVISTISLGILQVHLQLPSSGTSETPAHSAVGLWAPRIHQVDVWLTSRKMNGN